jgi:tetratricopeptide (TPR) repeat protein
MKKVALICALIILRGYGSYAADDPIKNSMKLYKQNHYEDAASLILPYLSEATPQQQGKTYLSLGLIYFANAKLYRELYHSSTAVQLDYLTKLLAADKKSESRFVKLYLGRTLVEAGKLVEAAAFFKKFLMDKGVQPPQKVLANIDLGTVLFLQGNTDKALNLWSRQKVSEPAAIIALAAAYGRAGHKEKNLMDLCQQALDQLAQTGKTPSIDSINNIIEVYTRKGEIQKGIDLLKHADLKTFSQEENLVRNKVIRFYNPALLKNLSRFYEKASLQYLDKAVAVSDEKLKGLARYYLSIGYGHFGKSDESFKIIDSFISSARLPAQFNTRARVAQAINNYLLGRETIAKKQLDTLLQSNAEPHLVADILLSCTRHNIEFPQAVISATAIAEKGEDRRFYSVNFALGRYYLEKKDYLRATTYMEAGRDKSNKNRIEFNDPLMLVNLAHAYYLTKKFSESLEIYFEMSKQFPAVRQIQVAMQGVYSMEQKSAGDVKIF